jgi:hypothetical protein
MHADVRDATRSLRADWRFALIASTLLAVTLGTLTAIFAIVQAIVLQPFPFRGQDRVVVIWQRDMRRAQPVIEVAYAEATDWARRSRSFERMAVVGSVNWSLDLVREGEAQRLSLAAVSAPFFEVLGSQPFLGRAFTATDEEGNVPRVAVISHGVWTRFFGRDSAVVGRTIAVRLEIDRLPVPVEVIGVAPQAFDFPRGTEVWVPAKSLVRQFAMMAHDDPDRTVDVLRVFFAIGRMKPGIETTTVETDLTRVVRTSDTQGGPEPPSAAVVTPIVTYLLGPARPVLWTLLGGAALMLLIACANVAGLQVSRAASRLRVQAIRAALGASNARLLRETLVESALLTSIAGVGAVFVAIATARILIWLAPGGSAPPRHGGAARRPRPGVWRRRYVRDDSLERTLAGAGGGAPGRRAHPRPRRAARLGSRRTPGPAGSGDGAGRGVPDARRRRRIVRTIGPSARPDNPRL